MPGRFEERMGIHWLDDDGVEKYGLVMSTDDGGFDIFRVMSIKDGIKCYDDGGAKWETDRDNVRLKSCPPPFSLMLLKDEAEQCYAYAARDALLHFSWTEAERLGMYAINDGAKVSVEDQQEAWNHVWRNEKEAYIPVETKPEPKPAPQAARPTERMFRLIAEKDAPRPPAPGKSGDYEFGG